MDLPAEVVKPRPGVSEKVYDTGVPQLIQPPAETLPPRPGQFPLGPARPIESPGQPQSPVPTQRPEILPEMTDSAAVTTGSTSTIRLVRALGSTSRQTSFGARRSLERRGFTATEFQLAEQLHDPDPGVRRQLVSRISSVPRIDPYPWLMLLAQDPDRQVRMEAVSILATSQRTAVTQHLRELAEAETDAEVLTHLRKLLLARDGIHSRRLR